MKIAFLVNQTHKEEDNCSTALMAFTALKRGHTIIYIGIADFVYAEDGSIGAYSRIALPDSDVHDNLSMVKHLRDQEKKYRSLDDVDVLWVRLDPTVDLVNRPWAPGMGLQFASRLKKRGKLVVNDPDSLTFYNNKLYLEDFPLQVRPPSIVTRQYDEVTKFMEKYPAIIIKPLQGSTGKNVFYIDGKEPVNLRQIVEVVSQDGYFVVQKYLPEARQGDVRLYLLDGELIEMDGHHACLKRVPAQDDVRSNIHQGGQGIAATVTPEYLSIIEDIKQKLVDDGMYLVGLDIVGNQLLEINVNSPGGLAKTNEVHGLDFTLPIIKHLEQKVANFYNKPLDDNFAIESTISHY